MPERGSRRRGLGSQLLLFAVVSVMLIATVPGEARADSVVSVRNGPRDLPRVALTFDDNYNTLRALAILDVLRRYDAPATVFVVGDLVRSHPAITWAIAEGTVEVGDHSASHSLLTGFSWSRLVAEIGGGTDAFHRMTGRRTVPLFRPPYGASSSMVRAVAGSEGFAYEVLWDVDTNDWRGYSASYIRNHVLRNARSGSIVLMHLSAPNTAAALPGIITGLRERGYELVTVSGLLKGHRRFFDVPAEGTHAHAVMRLVEAGIMSGYDEDYFGPYDGILRAQLAKAITLAGGIHTPEVDYSGPATFTDVGPVLGADGPSPYPFDYVEEAAAASLLNGRQSPDGTLRFDPWDGVSRIHLALIVARMARELKGYPPAGPSAPRFGDLPDWAVADVGLAASLGLLEGYGDGRFRPWNPAARVHVALVMSRYLDLPPAPTTTTTTTAPPSTTTTVAPTTTTSGSTTATTATTATTTTTTLLPTTTGSVPPATATNPQQPDATMQTGTAAAGTPAGLP